MQWKEPKTNMDGIFIIAHIIFCIPQIPHIIFSLVLIVYKIIFKKYIYLIHFSLISLISLIFPIIYTFSYISEVIKPINLTEKDYTTNNIEFNKLIKDKINSLNWRTFEFVMSSALLLGSTIIIIILVIIIIEKNKKNKNSFSNIQSPLTNEI